MLCRARCVLFLRPGFLQRGFNNASVRSSFDDEEPCLENRKVITNVYQENEVTANRPDDDIQAFMKQHNITIQGEAPKPILTNDEAPFPEPLRNLFARRNFRNPTAIQSLSWPLALSGKDMIGVAQTGSGKTLGYLLPAGMHIKEQPRTNHRGPIAVVLAPTRELVQQIGSVFSQWLVPSLRIREAQIYGGAPRLPQMNALRSGAELCIATPGRLLDFLDNNETSLNNSSFLVLDEADRMLDMGFEPQIRNIITRMRPDRQTVMFSATWPADVRMLAMGFMKRDAARINIGSTELCANKNVQQNFVFTSDDNDKKSHLFNYLQDNKDRKTLIFAATKRRVSNIAYDLIRSGFRCVESHGDLSQAKRERSLELFKSRCDIMVATDVAARGLDVQDIKTVINFDLPTNVEDYVHRIGRTGRAGKEGSSISFFTEGNGALARGLIALLKQAEQTVPQKLHELAESSRGPSPQFRQLHKTKPINFRISKGANWRNYGRRG